MKTIRVRYVDFWPGFNPKNDFFTKQIESLGFAVQLIVDRKQFSDIEFVSVFPNGIQRLRKNLAFRNETLDRVQNRFVNSGNIYGKKTSKIRVWYSGENIRPPIYDDTIDFFLSFDAESYSNRNFYFPYWFRSLNLGNQGKTESEIRVGAAINYQNLTVSRHYLHEKSLFACVFISNMHPIRLAAIEALQKIGKVDCFGSGVGKPVKNKFDVSKNYKFMICFENDLYPGYVTEKLVEAYASCTIPLYWGNLGLSAEYFNSESYLNYFNFLSLENFVEKVAKIEYTKTYTKPLLLKKIDLDNFNQIIYHSIA